MRLPAFGRSAFCPRPMSNICSALNLAGHPVRPSRRSVLNPVPEGNCSPEAPSSGVVAQSSRGEVPDRLEARRRETKLLKPTEVVRPLA